MESNESEFVPKKRELKEADKSETKSQRLQTKVEIQTKLEHTDPAAIKKEENNRFIAAIRKYGKDWEAVAKEVGGGKTAPQM